MPPKLVRAQVEMKSPGDILVKQLNEFSLQMHYVNSFDNDTNRAMISCLAPNCKLMRAKPISTPITSTKCAGLCWFMGPSKHCIYKDFCAVLNMSCRDPWTSKTIKAVSMQQMRLNLSILLQSFQNHPKSSKRSPLNDQF